MFGLVAYRLYYETFEKRGSDAGVRGIAFFFGIAFIIEVLIILQFGVDQRSVTASYIGKAWRIGEYADSAPPAGRVRGGHCVDDLAGGCICRGPSWGARSARWRRTRRRCG